MPPNRLGQRGRYGVADQRTGLLLAAEPLKRIREPAQSGPLLQPEWALLNRMPVV